MYKDYIQTTVTKDSDKINHPDDSEEEMIATPETEYFMTQFSLKKGSVYLEKRERKQQKKN